MSSSFAQRIAVKSAMPRIDVGMKKPVNIGFLAPLSGPVMSWGQPGLNGCQIWTDWLNGLGGVLIGGRRYPVNIVPYDCQYRPDKSLQGVRKLVQEHDVKLLMMLGGDSFSPNREYLMQNKVLTSTLLPTDLSPDTPYLIAPSEIHPILNVTGVDWVKRNKPHIKTVALCSQKDELGNPSFATYRAAFKAANIECVEEVRYDPEEKDPVPILDKMLAKNPDMLCWATSYTPMVHALTEYAYKLKYQGQILSCTMDNYQDLVRKTSAEFLEGAIFQFPDFDDPMLKKKTFFFNQPNQFAKEYNQRFPGSWSAVSWEFVAILDIWHAAVQMAGSTNSVSVLVAMKQLGQVTHAFGPAKWWGEDIFGISNALVGDWPVVAIRGGKARIEEFISIPDWLKQHGNLLKEEMRSTGQLWTQRLNNSRPATMGATHRPS